MHQLVALINGIRWLAGAVLRSGGLDLQGWAFCKPCKSKPPGLGANCCCLIQSGSFERFVMNLRKKALLGGLVGAGASVPAFAVDPATALEAVQTLTTSSAGFGPVMFGIAVASVGILIGVKWIKRSRGAA